MAIPAEPFVKTYPRVCRGKHGPHTINGPEDESLIGGVVKQPTCRACRNESKRLCRQRWYERDPLAYLAHVRRDTIRKRARAEALDLVKLGGIQHGTNGT